jgi:hypothetical protein
MDKAEYVFYKIAQGKPDPKLPIGPLDERNRARIGPNEYVNFSGVPPYIQDMYNFGLGLKNITPNGASTRNFWHLSGVSDNVTRDYDKTLNDFNMVPGNAYYKNDPRVQEIYRRYPMYPKVETTDANGNPQFIAGKFKNNNTNLT